MLCYICLCNFSQVILVPGFDNLILRPYKEEDAPALFNVINTNRQNLRPWLPWVDTTISEQSSLSFIQQSQSEAHEQKGIALGIFLQEEIIGGIGMHKWNQQLKSAEIGYWLSLQHQGKGMLHQCATAFIAYLFGQLQLNKIEVRFHPANKKSAAVAQRLHFSIEGILRDAQITNGLLHDMVVAGLLQREWRAIQHSGK